VKFLVLMSEVDHFDRWEALPEDEQAQVFACFEAFTAAVDARGSIVSSEALGRPEEARFVRGGAVTDGPYAETVEQLGGYFLIDVPTLEDAVELATLMPPAYTLEVRPVVPT
jgi:hypothetical protein